MKIFKGRIITCDSDMSVAKYMVIDKDKIIHVGDSLPAHYNSIKINEVKAVTPSFVDAHMHFAAFSLFNSGLNVSSFRSNQEIITAIKGFVKNDPAEYSISFGASAHSVNEKKLLSRLELDEATGGKPMVVVKYDGHALIANSAMIEKLPESIRQTRGYNEATGEMNQEAFYKVVDMLTASIPSLQLIKNMLAAVDYVAEKGISMFHTVSGIGFKNDLDVTLETIFAKGIKSIDSRIFFQTMDVEKVQKRKLPRIGGCFETALDGCFGSMDAALIHPYEQTENNGILFYTDEKVTDFCIEANRNGLQIQLHAIGDAAFDQACNALEQALKEYPRKDHRHTIIHACLPTQHGLLICSENDIVLSMQSSFIDWPLEPNEYMEAIIGKRAKDLNPIGRIHNMGIRISLGSDAPCTLPDPMLWIHNIVNNSIVSERIPILDAIRAVCFNGVYGSFDEKEYGSLEPGKYANFVVLDNDLTGVDKSKIKDIEVKALYTYGRSYKKQSRSIVRLLLKSIINPNKF